MTMITRWHFRTRLSISHLISSRLFGHHILQFSMNRLLALLVFSIGCTTLHAQFQEKNLTTEYSLKLHQEVANNNYQGGLRYIQLIQEADSLSYDAILDCISCFVNLNLYEEGIRFCDTRQKLEPQNDYLIFYATKGQLFYLMGKNEESAFWLEEYIDQVSSEPVESISPFYVMCATALYKAYRFEKAEKIFDKYFSMVLDDNNHIISGLRLTTETIGYELYDYAYCCFYQGKEQKGLKILSIAKSYGDFNAIQDYNKLINSKTFANNKEPNRKDIQSYNRFLKKRGTFEELSKVNVNLFWESVRLYSKEYRKIEKALSKKNIDNSLKESVNEYNRLSQSFESNRPDKFSPGQFTENLLDDIKQALGIYSTGVQDIYIFLSSQTNAFSAPDGYIYLTSDLVSEFHYDKNLVIPVCAHEVAHYICKHILAQAWATARKEEENRGWAALTISLQNLILIGGDIYAASQGATVREMDPDAYSRNNQAIINFFDTRSYFYGFQYSREQELEADLIAYRFLEAIGLGGYAMIMALEMLNDPSDNQEDIATNDHPTTQYRIEFLKYIYALEHQNIENDQKQEQVVSVDDSYRQYFDAHAQK